MTAARTDDVGGLPAWGCRPPRMVLTDAESDGPERFETFVRAVVSAFGATAEHGAP